ncbi:glycoside hydrolase family 3 N-terminal domain-containing protein [Streptomyces sp. UH6]|uniref:glycoside hydrolase family 3 N-terminal domain-containing protein n=1 Tax=Streptomyces sp. UH6 TaxID=2748379 RepID=UPI0015D51CA4|nr:glycoside hydrolase family 3 N-terminal domain-containing protein [Streptomyces sp. UH6]NYV75543.1 glycoside hydrolase family 3 C-terminal domain-containing protein [Streptomyces sp. UH6]
MRPTTYHRGRSGYRRRKRLTAALSVVAAFLTLAVLTVAQPSADATVQAAALPYQDASLAVDERVDDLLARMTLDDKIGQMTQADKDAIVPQSDVKTYRLGSVLSGGDGTVSPNTAQTWADTYDALQRQAVATPLAIPMIYGIDAVHGANAVRGATIFPHNIGLGATRDPALVERIGRAVAEEVSGTGVDWTFAPCLCVARNDRWGRTYESFGETPELVSSMATVVDGFQGADGPGSAPASVLATAKHYIGDGGTTNGTDQGNTQLTEAELRSVHLPPFKAAVDRGVGSVMLSYSSWNGVKVHGHKFLVTDLLKGELGFDGFVVSDWAAVDQLDGQTGFTADEVSKAVNAGVDMVMVPTDYKKFISLLRAEVNAGRVPMSRIDDANRRILTQKFRLGLFEKPLTDRAYTSTVGSAEHRALARQAVRASQVLLKNEGGVLPLAKSAKLFVAGKSADDIGNMSGGWTMSWQGRSGDITPGTTVLEGIREAATDSSRVTYERYGNGIDGSYTAAVAVVGETPYAEGRGDRPGAMGLDQEDLQTLAKLKASGVPVVVVLVSGRPLDIAAQLPDWKALIAAWLPGTEGGGVSDVLFGDHRPTGKLPMTWMRSASQQPINQGDGKDALFPYGHGLTYGTVTEPEPTPTPTPTPTPGSGICTVTAKVTSSWSGGYQADVTVRNTGTAPLTGWAASWDLGSRTITNVWNGTLTTSGGRATVRNTSWNGTVAAGGTVTFGYTANGSADGLPAPDCTGTTGG